VEQLITLDRTAAIPIGGGASSGALIAGVGVDIDDIFYAVESAANDSDDPALRAENTPLIAAIAKTLSATKVDLACGTTPAHVLNRMGAMTCGGCHQFSTDAEIAPGIAWPASLRFVHINEDGMLSPLLTDRFLPARFANVQTAVSAAFLASAEGPTVLDSRRNTLTGMLDALKHRGAGFTPGPDAEMDAAIASGLAGQIRQTSLGEPGAFVMFRKPD
jgi:hypothetical protein